MAPTPGAHRLGPSDGTIEVRTVREGLAQKVGHDLIIDVGQWQATVNVGEDGVPTAVELEVDARSLSVREGLHGVKPLTDKDRRDIKGTIDTKILRGQPIVFRSSGVRGDGALTVSGELSIAGTARPAEFGLELDGSGRLTATMPVTQTEFGITPYKGLLGALKVRDEVEVAIDVQLPAG